MCFAKDNPETLSVKTTCAPLQVITVLPMKAQLFCTVLKDSVVFKWKEQQPWVLHPLWYQIDCIRHKYNYFCCICGGTSSTRKHEYTYIYY